ncbi:ABC transporter ATP-binding protein [Gemmiger sp. An50]|uniref:ABC transporter ATP-binding protein n=1 Tax=Gemmiger sp. An50 TaxID=1965639 RepID=UPI000B3A8C47|nr:ABC transporter ATP-binding protein [Gemmiger sp. An50]OUN83918.1 macrolide ABC transporter ATP-binding protein [Gemmiger sp. An50]
MSDMLRLQDINKSYPMGEERVQVLKQASLTVQAGEFISILGASGSGKSTLMNIIGCMDTADRGSYSLDGEDVFRLDTRQLAALRNRKIGFIFQRYHLLAQYDVLQNVMMPLLLQGFSHQQAAPLAVESLTAMGLGDRLRHRPNQLSGGQQQRVAIARALVGKPALLLADEPTGALDTRTGQEILELFRQLNRQGHTIIQITHDLTVASAASRILHLRDGVLTDQ